MPEHDHVEDDNWRARCHFCHRKITFANVTYLMNSALAWRCECDWEKSRRITRAGTPGFQSVFDALIEGWERVRLPYVAAELPALPVVEIQHECDRMTVAMHEVRNVHDFLAECAAERRVPDSSDGDDDD
jgi:hypothetical protein